jgi:hypothetical protein
MSGCWVCRYVRWFHTPRGFLWTMCGMYPALVCGFMYFAALWAGVDVWQY